MQRWSHIPRFSGLYPHPGHYPSIFSPSCSQLSQLNLHQWCNFNPHRLVLHCLISGSEDPISLVLNVLISGAILRHSARSSGESWVCPPWNTAKELCWVGLQKCSRGASLCCCAAQEDSVESEGAKWFVRTGVNTFLVLKQFPSFLIPILGATVIFSGLRVSPSFSLPGFGVSPQPRCYGNVGIIREPHSWTDF